MIERPLLLMPAGFRPATKVVDGRDAQGRRIKRVLKRDQDRGVLGGWEHYHHDGRNDATVLPPTVTVTLSASQFGLTVDEMRAVVARRIVSRPRRTPGGIHLP